MIITNFKNLAKSPLRKKALQIVEAGYEAINIEEAVKNKIEINKNKLLISNFTIDLNKYRKIFIIGIGKGSALASATLAKILGKKLDRCIALDISKPPLNSKFLILNSEFLVGTHPFPSIQNIKATKKIIEMVEKAGKDDLIISFICGGGSALLCGSEKELKASREIFSKLTNAGANIIELNTIRKHLSEVKGGGLTKIAYPATMISLVVSDVFKNDLSMVASGPTIYDKTTKKDAEKILSKFNTKYKILNIKYQLNETPKDKKYFKKVKNILFISNCEPITAMAKKAKKLGFSPKIYSYNLKGEARNILLPLIEAGKSGAAVISGGETTIVLGENPGKGGRNMEAVLGSITNPRCPIPNNLITISFASDGKDNTEAAGAIGDILTINKAEKLKLDFEKYLKIHNTFNFFKKTGDLIFADKKTFNVSDLMLVLKEK
ncbi:MAG: DUF4147 domain-containing protein [Spirochaetia bacterium]|nr:MAG: DUF4147 domain-containing protein [Spirochaetia bacterium]